MFIPSYPMYRVYYFAVKALEFVDDKEKLYECYQEMKKEIQAAQCWYQPTPTAAFNWKMQKYNMNVFGELQIAND